MLHHKKKLTLIIAVSLTVFLTAATISPVKPYKNLKVLPRDISEKQLDSIMKAYNKALDVTCDFCHVKPTNFTGLPAVTDSLDYARDGVMKEDARRMIRLTIDINKTYFNTDSNARPEFLNTVSCNTCHRGNPFPANE